MKKLSHHISSNLSHSASRLSQKWIILEASIFFTKFCSFYFLNTYYISPLLPPLTIYLSGLLFGCFKVTISILIWFDLLVACCLTFLLKCLISMTTFISSFHLVPFQIHLKFFFVHKIFILPGLSCFLDLSEYFKCTYFITSFQSFWSLFLQYAWSHYSFFWAYFQWDFFFSKRPGYFLDFARVSVS